MEKKIRKKIRRLSGNPWVFSQGDPMCPQDSKKDLFY